MFAHFDLGVFLLAVLPLLLAITLHEATHAYMARHCGDNTAHLLGRTTLNPLAHIDPIGTLVVPFFLLAINAPFLFGWAKPVPFLARNFRHTRQGIRWVAAAGPMANLIQAMAWAVIMMIAPIVPEAYTEPLSRMANYGIVINIGLFVLNLLPILPLDGGRILDSFLPARWSLSYQKLEPYGIYIWIFLAMSGLLNVILSPIVQAILDIFYHVIRTFYK